MKRIRRFDPVKTATVLGVLYALVTAVIFIPLGLIFSLVGANLPTDTGGFFFPAAGGIMFFLFPVIYGFVAFVFGIIGCAVYNLVAKWTGGIALDIVDEAEVENRPTLD
jgi:hypothetical protein